MEGFWKLLGILGTTGTTILALILLSTKMKLKQAQTDLKATRMSLKQQIEIVNEYNGILAKSEIQRRAKEEKLATVVKGVQSSADAKKAVAVGNDIVDSFNNNNKL